MNKKLYVGGLVLLPFVLSIVFVIFSKNVEVSAASTVFSGHPYDVHLSEILDEKAIEEGEVYVTDENGEKVEAKITLQENKRSLRIENVGVGKYVLHIESKAFQKSIKKQKLEFEVIEQLESIQSVEDLEKYFKAIRNIRSDYNITIHRESAVEETAVTANDSSSSGGHSTTNNQVEDIDEGDIVITDGKYIYATKDGKIIIVEAENPKNLKHVSTIQLKGKGHPMQLMKEGNLLIVLYDEFIEDPRNNEKRYYGGKTFTKVAVYDVSRAFSPKLVKEFGQEGNINGIRKYEGVLYVVTNFSPMYWMMEDGDELRPHLYEDEKTTPMDVKDIAIIPGSMEPSYTVISAIDLTNLSSKKVNTKGYLGSSSTLYMSEHALYLTAINYGPVVPMDLQLNILEDASDTVSNPTTSMSVKPYEQKTNIYKFSIDGTNIELTASGMVDGHVLNQFSMDEYKGYFRIATTEGSAWGANANSKNHLFILNENLKKVGEVTDLARGERIYSARFMGEKAYIVTFKETDPLFVIDMEDPKNPKVLGELKIPGFSNYLHPLDENHLIGIGYDTELRMEPWSKEPFVTTKGMKISLFDVSDFANPKEKDTEIIGGRGTYSEVQYNHKALFRHEGYSYYGFPVMLYEEGGQYGVTYKGSGALVYEITPEKGIQLKGNLIIPAKKGELYEDWESNISRLLYIRDALYTVANKEIKSYDLKTFEKIGQVEIK